MAELHYIRHIVISVFAGDIAGYVLSKGLGNDICTQILPVFE